MNSTHIDTHPSRILDLLIPASAKKVIPMLGGDISALPDSFSLSRMKGGTEVWLHCGRLNVNLTIHLKHCPANFVAARAWIKELEVRFAIDLPERPRRRRGLRLRVVGAKA